MPDFSDLEGKTFPSFTYTIERSKVREFLLAIGDTNPVYLQNEPPAPLPPTFATVISFWGGFGIAEVMQALGVEMQNVLHGDQEYTHLRPIYVGDTVTGTTRISSVKSRGGMDFIGLNTVYINQAGDKTIVEQATVIVRGGDT